MVGKVQDDKDFDAHADYIYFCNELFFYQKEI